MRRRPAYLGTTSGGRPPVAHLFLGAECIHGGMTSKSVFGCQSLPFRLFTKVCAGTYVESVQLSADGKVSFGAVAVTESRDWVINCITPSSYGNFAKVVVKHRLLGHWFMHFI